MVRVEKRAFLDATMMGVKEAEGILKGLASLFAGNPGMRELAASFLASGAGRSAPRDQRPNLDARYRTLVEQIPAVIFMAFLDRGISEAYVSPHIESVLGFSQREWLDDPVRWYRQIHPEDLKSGHIHSEASSHEYRLVRVLVYDTPRL